MDNIDLIGLTGGIGCGKSAALKAFSLLNCNILDADEMCHDLYNESDGVIVRAIVKRWGKEVIKSDIVDRQKIAKIIFNDEKERKWLNQLIHPLIFEKAYKLCRNSKNLLIFDVPLLFEAGWEQYFTKTIAVWTTPNLQYKRLKQRNWTDQEIRSRIDAQMSVDEKLKKADFGIINVGNLEFLFKQCKNILLEVINDGRKKQ